MALISAMSVCERALLGYTWPPLGKLNPVHAATQDFLNRIELDEDTVLTVLDGLKDVLGDKGLAVLNFLQFMLVYHWLASTVQAYGAKLNL